MLTQSPQGLKQAQATSGANEALVVETKVQPADRPHRLEWIGVRFSATPIHTGIIIEIISDAGDAFATRLLLGNIDDENLFYQPDADLNLQSGDTIRVTVPAGGAAITSTATIQMREG